MDETNTYTPHAQQLLTLARQEADRFHHCFVGTEHLLLGLSRLGQGVAFNVLTKMSLNLETIRVEVEKQIGTGPDEYKTVGNIPYTPRVKKVLMFAGKEAAALRHIYVGTEHILLGLLREGDGVAARVLSNLGVELVQTRQRILEELNPAAAAKEKAKPSEPNEPVAGPSEPAEAGAGLILKRYDVYCDERAGGTVVYRNVHFRGINGQFPQGERLDFLSQFIRLEQPDGQVVFVARSSIIKFCEHGANPGGEKFPPANA